MKIKSILFTVLVALVITTGAFAEITYFTCDSDPADFNGKTFDNLYVFIEGCENFDSTVIPGKDSFVTLKDIQVNEMFFADDHYDPATKVYVDADLNDKTKHADTYLNIAGNSDIKGLEIQCVYAHDCNIGIQYPSRVVYMEQPIANEKSLGKTIIRGYIDPFVDERTDYYHDTSVKSFPNFNIETFDVDFSLAALKSYNEFNTAALTSVEFAQNMLYPYGLHSFIESKTASDELLPLFKRGSIEMLRNTNPLGQNIEFELDLANIQIEDYLVDNSSSVKSYNGNNWKPYIVSRGYTTVGSFNSNIDFATDVYTPAPFSPDSKEPETAVLPMYIDLMILGGTGHTVNYDMNHTRITMLNYIGNEDAGSKLNLTMGKIGNVVNMPAIAIANIIGGKFDLSCKESVRDIPSIDSLNFYEGTKNYSYDETGSEEAINTWMSLYYSDDKRIDDVFTYRLLYLPSTKTYAENTATAELRKRRNDLYNNEVLPLNNFARTDHGYFEISATLDGMIQPGDTDMAGKSVVSFHTENVSLGDIGVSKNLGSIANLLSGRCNYWQHGEQKISTTFIK